MSKGVAPITEYEGLLKTFTDVGMDIRQRTLHRCNVSATILHIKSLIDQKSLSEFIIKPLLQSASPESEPLTAERAIDEVIIAGDCRLESDKAKIHENLLAGMTIILFHGFLEFLVVDIKEYESRPVESPQLTYTLRGARDCFTENLAINLSLIRYRVKDPGLRIEKYEVGQRTKTVIAVVFIEDIANNKFVREITNRISNIIVDGIVESGQLQAFLLNSRYNLFPQMGIVERSDMAADVLLEGKVLVITEGSGLALTAPLVFGEFLQSCDDIFDNKYFGMFNKCLRIIALTLMLTLPSLYVAVVSFHNDVLSGEYILSLVTMRSMVPFNAFVEAFTVEIFTELLREALLRVPKQIGPAIGIVGAIIIGQAAVAAGIFSPLILIISSVSLLASFVIPDYTIINPFRIIKFLLLILTGAFGLLGFTIGIFLILAELISTNSFGVAFFAPLAPFNWKDTLKSFFFSKTLAPKRPTFMYPEDDSRL